MALSKPKRIRQKTSTQIEKRVFSILVMIHSTSARTWWPPEV